MALFASKNKLVLDEQPITTLISNGCVVDGNLKALAFARVDGQVTGDVSIADGLIVGETGIINGNVVTKEMIVYGSVKGNIETNSLEIKSTGKILGEIKTQVLKVDTGAVYTGYLTMETTDKPLLKM